MRTHPSKGATRLALYETVREYACESRAESIGAVATRHARHTIDAASRWLADLDARREGALLCLSLEHENLLASHAWALERGEVRLAMRAMLALTPSLRRRAPTRTELELLEATLACAPPNEDVPFVEKGWLLVARSRLMMMTSRFDDADANLHEALQLARTARDRLLEGRALVGLFSSAEATERYDAARHFIEQAVVALEGTGSRWRAVGGLAVHFAATSKHAEARERFEQAEELWARDSESGYEGTAHYYPAMHAEYALLLEELGRSDDASEQLRRAFDAARELGPRVTTLLTYYQAAILHSRGEIDAAMDAYRTATEATIGALYQPLILGGLGGALASAGRLDEARAAFAKAEAMVSLGASRDVLSIQRTHLVDGKQHPREALHPPCG